MNKHIQEVNLQLWTPGTNVAVDEIMARFQGQASEATTIPGKPTPTGFKIWAIAQYGFILQWFWHIPGEKNGPVGVKTPVELGGSKRDGNRGNKTQAVAYELLKSLPGGGYHCFMDNLFCSTRFLDFLRSKGYGATGTCRTNAGLHADMIQWKNSDKGDILPWGTTKLCPTKNRKVLHLGFKDNAAVLGMTTVIDGNQSTKALRHKPKATSTSARTARAPFGHDEYCKLMQIPTWIDTYNRNMNGVDRGDQLAAMNAGLRNVRRGGWQAIEHWLLRVVLCNCFLLAWWAGPDGPREINFRSQKDFRHQLIDSLLSMSKDISRSKKRRISHINIDSDTLPSIEHERIKTGHQRQCAAHGGLRLSDKPQKRQALAEIASSNNRPYIARRSIFGCRQCGVALCPKGVCWTQYHNI